MVHRGIWKGVLGEGGINSTWERCYSEDLGKEFQLRRKTSVTGARLFQAQEVGSPGQGWPSQGSRKAGHLLWLECGGRGRHWSLVSAVNYWVHVTQGCSVILGILDLILGPLEGTH